MKKVRMPLASFKLKNFKAVRDSKEIRLTPLTVFIGNNGSGKSSLIEGLETYQSILTRGLDEAMYRWRGFEYIRNSGARHISRQVTDGRSFETNPIEFKISYHVSSPDNPFIKDEKQSHSLSISATPSHDEVFIFEEQFEVNKKKTIRNKDGVIAETNPPHILQGGESLINYYRNSYTAYRDAYNFVQNWQFVAFNPLVMGDPRPQKRSGGLVRLEHDGSNIAEYLLDIRKQDLEAFEGIVETLQSVLPYAKDLQPTLTSELERNVYLQLTEGQTKIPGWLLSTGTLRILALLALFRHPSPPPLIVIEEIENGLDPITLSLVVREIAHVVNSGISQVIVTTHSPYLLDFLSLDHLIIVERDENGQPVFYRPSDEIQLKGWKESFKLGELYTMGRLRR